MTIPIRFLLLAITVGGCAVDGRQADVGETTQAAGATYECVDICPPPGHGLPPVCHHICVLDHDKPEIGGGGQASVCNEIHQPKCGDGCCDSQEAARFENGGSFAARARRIASETRSKPRFSRTAACTSTTGPARSPPSSTTSSCPTRAAGKALARIIHPS